MCRYVCGLTWNIHLNIDLRILLFFTRLLFVYGNKIVSLAFNKAQTTVSCCERFDRGDKGYCSTVLTFDTSTYDCSSVPRELYMMVNHNGNSVRVYAAKGALNSIEFHSKIYPYWDPTADDYSYDDDIIFADTCGYGPLLYDCPEEMELCWTV